MIFVVLLQISGNRTKMSRDMTKPTNWLCAQRRLRSAWASAQSDQSLRCPHEESLGPKLPNKRTAKTLIRLGGCPGWSESLLGAQLLCWFWQVAAQILVWKGRDIWHRRRYTGWKGWCWYYWSFIIYYVIEFVLKKITMEPIYWTPLKCNCEKKNTCEVSVLYSQCKIGKQIK